MFITGLEILARLRPQGSPARPAQEFGGVAGLTGTCRRHAGVHRHAGLGGLPPAQKVRPGTNRHRKKKTSFFCDFSPKNGKNRFLLNFMFFVFFLQNHPKFPKITNFKGISRFFFFNFLRDFMIFFMKLADVVASAGFLCRSCRSPLRPKRRQYLEP